jgi:hypothetical protein
MHILPALLALSHRKIIVLYSKYIVFFIQSILCTLHHKIVVLYSKYIVQTSFSVDIRAYFKSQVTIIIMYVTNYKL